jgi:hemerythrin-like domain-containing protein
MVGINYVLNMAWSIVNKSAGVDDKTRLQALALINDCNKYKIDLTANGVIVTDAIRYVQGQMDHLNKTEKALLQDIKQKEGKEEQQEEDIGQQKTHNGIF